jgi:hypothetical protein
MFCDLIHVIDPHKPIKIKIMKTKAILRPLAVLLAAFILVLSGCTSMTLIQSVPPGAKIYINDEIGGETPYTLSDTRIIGSSTSIRIEKSGYKPFMTVIQRTEEIDPGPLVCGFIFTPVWWLWAMKYKPMHTYELVPAEQ